MYASKHAGRLSAGRQSKDVLLRALTERNPMLGGHLSGVAELAERTARRLGLPPEEVERIRHAGELHDAGKVAIPDGILAKPGPLDEEEWALRAPPHADRRADRALRARADRASPSWSARPTSAGTAAATPTACAPTRSRSARASSPSPTPSTR